MKRRDVFEVLEPLPGGLTRLRAHLPKRHRSRVWAPALAAGLAAALMVVGGTWSRGGEQPEDLIGAVRDSVFERELAEPVTLEAGQAGALQRLPSSTPQVLLYRVAMLDPSMAPPPP